MSETPATRKAAIWVVVVFLLGAIAGGMFGYAFAHRSVAAAGAQTPEPERRAKRVEQLTRDLGLTADQAKQLDSILLQYHGNAKAIHDQFDAQMGQLRQKGRAEILAILTPEQKPKFEEFLRKKDEERKRNISK